MGPDPNYEVFNEEIEVVLKSIGDSIGGSLPEDWGFMLMIFDLNKQQNGNLFYISSGKREDVIKVMEEFITKQKEQNHEPKNS